LPVLWLIRLVTLILIGSLVRQINVEALELDPLFCQALAESRQVFQQDRAGLRSLGFYAGDKPMFSHTDFHTERPEFRRTQPETHVRSQLARGIEGPSHTLDEAHGIDLQRPGLGGWVVVAADENVIGQSLCNSGRRGGGGRRSIGRRGAGDARLGYFGSR
jgi:hypothetical protein